MKLLTSVKGHLRGTLSVTEEEKKEKKEDWSWSILGRLIYSTIAHFVCGECANMMQNLHHLLNILHK